MKMMSVIAVTPKEGAADEITDLIVESRKDGVDGLDHLLGPLGHVGLKL